jgi:ubiquinone/menaquinone biosynthesis C-methylase UbiE
MIEFRYLDAQKLDIPGGSFDAVFLYDSLQHIKDKETALKECVRVIKPKGVVCVIEWNKKTVDSENEEFGYDIDYVDPQKIIKRKDISIELIQGDYVNIFLIRKK